MKILITGGAGYIGSVTNRFLRDAGYETVIFDNLATGHPQAVGDTELIRGDLRNREDIARAVSGRNFDAVIHFAALALAGESMREPYRYYENNILGGLNLLEAMRTHSVPSVIFSSTCAVYGYPDRLPVTEDEAYKPVSVYGSSKRMFEEILEWYGKVHGIRYASLRYFNAAGAYPDGSLGEDHPDESHIIPIAISVAMGRREHFDLLRDGLQNTGRHLRQGLYPRA
jgi:UDP-glucose 4-epimerase